MGKPDPPAVPDPKATSAASTGTNVSTAIANAEMGNINENGPNGSTSVSQTGTYKMTDPYTGQSYDVPTFTRNTTLSPAQQGIADQNNRAKLNLSTTGANLSGTLGAKLQDNFTLGNKETEDRLSQLGAARLDPRFAQEQTDLQSQLSNQGIKLGSAAYDRAMQNFGQTKNDAYNQLYLNGRQTADQESLTQDNQRINQISALMNGGQVSQPNFMGANMPTIPTTDNAGIINTNYNQQMQGYQQQMAQSNSLVGGLFGLGAGILKSDRTTKKDIEPVGKLKGHKLYEFRYKGQGADTPKQIGVMAQEVKKTRPDVVSKRPDGKMQVNYGKLFAATGGKGGRSNV